MGMVGPQKLGEESCGKENEEGQRREELDRSWGRGRTQKDERGGVGGCENDEWGGEYEERDWRRWNLDK